MPTLANEKETWKHKDDEASDLALLHIFNKFPKSVSSSEQLMKEELHESTNSPHLPNMLTMLLLLTIRLFN
jgi:hypothetical protein